MDLTEKQQKIKKILILAITNGELLGLDTCVYIELSKYLANDRQINFNQEYLLLSNDLIEIYDFLCKSKIIIKKFQVVEEELSDKVPELVASGKLSNKVPYYLEDIKKELTFDKDIIDYTEEEKRLSEKFGFTKNAFGRPKDNRNDLLIVICSKREKVKMIITSNNSDRNPDFDWCDKRYREIYPDDDFEIIYVTPTELAPVIRELKEEYKDKFNDLV